MPPTLLLVTDPEAPGGADLFSLELAKAALQRGIRTAIQPMPRAPNPRAPSLRRSSFAKDSDIVVVNGFQIEVLRTVKSMNKRAAVRLLGVPVNPENAPSAEFRELAAAADLLLLPSRHLIDTMRGLGLGPRSLHLVPFAYDRIPAENAALLPLSAMPLVGFHLVCVLPEETVMHECFDVLLMAFSLMPSDCHLSVIGDGAAARALKARAGKLGALGRMSFLGELSRARTHEHLRLAQALIDPCVHSGFPILPLNALSEGCPVVAAAGGGHPELVADGENGLLFSPGDPRAAAEAVLRLRHADGLSRKLIASGIRTVKEHTWERTALAALEALERLGTQPGRAGSIQ